MKRRGDEEKKKEEDERRSRGDAWETTKNAPINLRVDVRRHKLPH